MQLAGTAAVRVYGRVTYLNLPWPKQKTLQLMASLMPLRWQPCTVTVLPRYHVFIDGKKRTALVAAELFLQLNSWRLGVDDADRALSTGNFTKDAFADWLRLQAHKKTG